MPLKLNSTGGGSVTLDTPSTAGTYTVTVPATNQTLGITSGTAVSASGTAVDFTDIPSWVKRITVMLSGVSFAASSAVWRLRIGSGSLSTSGYSTVTSTVPSGSTPSVSVITDGLAGAGSSSATNVLIGSIVLTNISGNTWVSSVEVSRDVDLVVNIGNGFITLGGVLDRVSFVATTGAFDAGSINIMYEG